MNLRKSAKGQPCLIRIPGHCTHDPETVVLCHDNLESGMGMKAHDLHGAFGCHVCHAIVDGRRKVKEFTRDELRLMFYQGMVRTQKVWLREGMVVVR